MPKSNVTYGQDFAKVEAILGTSLLKDEIISYGIDNSYSSLFPIING